MNKDRLLIAAIFLIIVSALTYSYFEHRDDLTPEEMIAKSPDCNLHGMQLDAAINAYRAANNAAQLVDSLRELNVEDNCSEVLVRAKFDEERE